jgi:hypothetical protein
MSRHDSACPDKIESTTTTTFEGFVTEQLRKLFKRLDKLESEISRSSSASSETAPLKLGPYPLRTPRENYKPAAEDYSLERILNAARQHSILQRWARDWYHQQSHYGWRDSYGNPIRSVERYLSYSWRIACKNNPALKARGEREADKHAYADFAEKGKDPVMLPIPPSDADWKDNQDKIQKMISQVRKTA